MPPGFLGPPFRFVLLVIVPRAFEVDTLLLTTLEARAAALFNEDGWALIALMVAELLNLRALLKVFAGRLAALGIEELVAELE